MSSFSLRFLGVGNAQAPTLGASAAVLERDGRPCLLVDCGPDTLDAYLGTYHGLPAGLFVSHAHMDHIGGLEGLFYRVATGPQPPSPPRLYCPVTLVPILQRRLADYPNILAEGGANFWDAFQLIPVAERFWHEGLLFSVFPVRHHEHLTAFGLGLAGRFLYTGDTRPIPEVLARYASRDEWIFHDCASRGNPSHTGVEDIAAEYQPEQWRRMVFYHYESREAGRLIEAEGYRIAHRGELFDLMRPVPTASCPGQDPTGNPDVLIRLEATG